MLTAVASKGYVFDNWSGDADSAAASGTVITVLMDRNRTIDANFAQSDLHYTVTAISEPSGGGSIQFSDPQPAGGYQVNASITVRAVEQTGYVFSRWTGDLAGNQNPRTVLVSDNKAITAVFNPTVTAYCSPSEAGSITLQPESSNGYAAGTEVAISARANKGYRFVSWEGDVSGSDRSITITVDEAKTITARFAEQSSSRWWLWVILGLAGLFGALILVRLVYARMNRGWTDEPPEPDN
jgi:Divergent InlB B-repeat domain